jgi:hypothetical protein
VQATKGGFASKHEAREALREVIRRASATDIDCFDVTVGDFLEQSLASKRTLRPSTVQAYRSHIDLYLRPMLGTIQVRDLKPKHLDELYQAIAVGVAVGRSLRRRCGGSRDPALGAGDGRTPSPPHCGSPRRGDRSALAGRRPHDRSAAALPAGR